MAISKFHFLTQAQYDALSPAEKQRADVIYFLKGLGVIIGSTSAPSAGEALSTQEAVTLLAGKLSTTLKGAASGLAELDAEGRVPASQLPSYVDDVLEFDNLASFPATGETGKIYVAKDTNKTYRWSGSAYVTIASDLALGETSSTAYRGDRGKTAYDHSQVVSGNPHGTAAGDITSGTFDAARIPSLNASKITAGTFGADRIPALPTSKITGLDTALGDRYTKSEVDTLVSAAAIVAEVDW